MISQEKSYILTTLQKLPKNVEDLGKLIVAKDFKKLPKVQKIAKSGHTAGDGPFTSLLTELLTTLFPWTLFCQIWFIPDENFIEKIPR